MTDRDDKASIIFPVVVGLCAWLVPGGGHFLLKETKRAIILFVAITILFVLGIYLGSIAVVDPVNEKTPQHMIVLLTHLPVVQYLPVLAVVVLQELVISNSLGSGLQSALYGCFYLLLLCNRQVVGFCI